MGIFGDSKTQFDTLVEKVTDEKNTTEDWGLIMSVCDRVGATTTGPKECLRALIKRLNHPDPHVVIQAITLLDACVNNCGRYFLLEIASREFETEYRKLLSKSHPKVAEKLKSMLKRWVEGEFSKDAQYSLIPSLYSNLKREGIDFSNGDSGTKKTVTELPKDPLVVSSQQEEDDIAKAIQLSLQENKASSGVAKTSGGGGGIYPVDSLYTGGSGGASQSQTSTTPAPQPKKEKKARALYDFEAAEDNELTFKAGEMVIILDDADPNWWKGSNHRGEGLFPSNFVTTDLDAPLSSSEAVRNDERKRSVVFNEEVEVQEVEQVTFPAQETIDQAKIETLLSMLHEADPTTGEADPPDMPRLEQQVGAMGPLIDAELERTDRRHAQLTRLSHELVDALSLYHSLMREVPANPGYPSYPPGNFPMPGPQGMGSYLPPPQGGVGGPLPPPHVNGGVPPPGYYQPPVDGGGMVSYQPGYLPPLNPGQEMMPGSAPPPTPPLQTENLQNM